MAVSDVLTKLYPNSMAEKLPSSYSIDNTIIANLMSIIQDEVEELKTAIEDVEKMKNFDFIFGKTIDYYANDYEEKREGDNDSDFKDRLRTLKITYGSLGDEDTILKSLASYFKYEVNRFSVKRIDTRTIEITYPAELDDKEVLYIAKKVKAAGIRLIVTKNDYWEDYTFDELATRTYDELAKLRYERRK